MCVFRNSRTTVRGAAIFNKCCRAQSWLNRIKTDEWDFLFLTNVINFKRENGKKMKHRKGNVGHGSRRTISSVSFVCAYSKNF